MCYALVMQTYSGDPAFLQNLFWLYSNISVYAISVALIVTGAGLLFLKRGRSTLS